jgi:hypothetical protein
MGAYDLCESCRFEVFEFVDPKEEQRENNFEYWKTGFFHIGITDPNQKNSGEGRKATE